LHTHRGIAGPPCTDNGSITLMGKFHRFLLTACLLSLLNLFPARLPARADEPPPSSPPPNPDQPSSTSQTLYLPAILTDFQEPLGDLSSPWYLMVDDGHLQYRDVGRLYHPFQKYSSNPLIRADKTWEGDIIQLYGTVFPGFRMWYSSLNDTLNLSQVLYAQSADGLTWSKPNLPGGAGNALFSGQSASLVSVIHTPQDRKQAYKLVVYQNNAFYGYYSNDGLATTPAAVSPLVISGGDMAHFYWDPHTSQYRGTFKGSELVFGVRRRVVRFIDSSDFSVWSQAPDFLAADIIDDVVYPGYYPALYGMPVFPLGEQYIGLLWLIKARDTAGAHGQVLVQLVSSHDGLHWIREEGNRPAILDVGPSGAWDSGQVYTALRPVKVDNRLWLYYSGCNREHGANLNDTRCSIGLARIGMNRLASLTGSGAVITEMLNPDGGRLHLNYDGSKGAVRVELMVDGVTIPGYQAANCTPLTADSQDQVVSWTGGSTLPLGSFQIKFLLDDSALYAFAMID
jgi:hypothetical protein